MNLSDLRSRTRRLLNLTQDGQQYADAELNQALNDYYDLWISEIMMNQGMWEVNSNDYTADLKANQTQYDLLVQASRISKIQINYSGTSQGWQVSEIFNQKQSNIALANAQPIGFGSAPSIRVSAGSFYLYPFSSVDVVGGIKITVDDLPNLLIDDTDEPFIVRPYTIGLAYGAACDYALNKKPDVYKDLLAKYTDIFTKCTDFYAQRMAAANPRITVAPNDTYSNLNRYI